MMVLDTLAARSLTGPACVDGIGPADDAQGYWQRAAEARRKSTTWANGG
jgi:hypothetical protein